jgi:hypothetical protein
MEQLHIKQLNKDQFSSSVTKWQTEGEHGQFFLPSYEGFRTAFSGTLEGEQTPTTLVQIDQESGFLPGIPYIRGAVTKREHMGLGYMRATLETLLSEISADHTKLSIVPVHAGMMHTLSKLSPNAREKLIAICSPNTMPKARQILSNKVEIIQKSSLL